MSADVNKVILVGRLGSDPEHKELSNNNQLVTFPLATTSGFGDKETTEWHKIKAFGKTAELCSRYLSKGRQCYIEGRVQYRRWEKDDGVRYFTNIIANRVVFLGGGKRNSTSVDDAGFSTEEQVPF